MYIKTQTSLHYSSEYQTFPPFYAPNPTVHTMSSSATLNRRLLHRQTFRILNGNSLHFITVALLFLPITYSASLLLQFYYSGVTLLSLKTLITFFPFALFAIPAATAGIALITYSVNQSIYRKPLTVSSAVKLLSHSYIPLLSTVLAGSLILALISLLFTLFPVAIARSTEALGFHFDPFIFSSFINTFSSCALALTVLFFIVIWGSAAAIAVLELKSGFEPLRQSANQSTEFRSYSFSIAYLSAFVIGFSLSHSVIFKSNMKPETNWIWILPVGVLYFQSSLAILVHVVANTVLYVHCKEARGEKMAVEGEVSGEYVTEVLDDDYEEVHESAKRGFSHTVNLIVVFWCVAMVYTAPVYVYPLFKYMFF